MCVEEVSAREALIHVMIFYCCESTILRAEDNVMHLKILLTNLHKAWFGSPVALSLIDLSKDQSEI